MARRLFAILSTFAIMLMALAAPVKAQDGGLECVPYARAISGIRIFGNAWTWWGQAEGSYARGKSPRVGAVLAMKSTSVMPYGHVATVSRILDDRQILLDHANWSYPGQIEHDVLAVDVSPNNDWSSVRVWYGPSAKLGARTNPVYGFIYASGNVPERATPRLQFARQELRDVSEARVTETRHPRARQFIIEYLEDKPQPGLPEIY